MKKIGKQRVGDEVSMDIPSLAEPQGSLWETAASCCVAYARSITTHAGLTVCISRSNSAPHPPPQTAACSGQGRQGIERRAALRWVPSLGQWSPQILLAVVFIIHDQSVSVMLVDFSFWSVRNAESMTPSSAPQTRSTFTQTRDEISYILHFIWSPQSVTITGRVDYW